MLPSLLHLTPDPIGALFCGPDAQEDLNVRCLAEAMAGGNPALREDALQVLSRHPARSVQEVHHRQAVLGDALDGGTLFGQMLDCLAQGLGAYQHTLQGTRPTFSRFTSAVSLIRAYAGQALVLLDTAERLGRLLGSASFSSAGMMELKQGYLCFYDDSFLAEVRRWLEPLSKLDADLDITVAARAGNGLKGTGYVLCAMRTAARKPQGKGRQEIPLHSNRLQAKGIELQEAALGRVRSIVRAVRDQMAKQLEALRFELGFYVGCCRLHQLLGSLQVPLCQPQPLPQGSHVLAYEALCDVSLAIASKRAPTGNSWEDENAALLLISGANQGGKSTYLRSLGLAQLMMQCGMFVCARSFRAPLASAIHTHFCRPEDERLHSGKLDEEMARLSGIVDALRPHALLLMNESFSSTSQQEGTAIAESVLAGLHGIGVRTACVTHLTDLVRIMLGRQFKGLHHFSAQRAPDGSRTYAILPAPAAEHSHAMDLYDRILGG